MRLKHFNVDNYYKDFGAFIKDVRISRGLLQQEVADSLGITQPYLSRLEKGERPIDLGLAMTICEVLNADIN